MVMRRHWIAIALCLLLAVALPATAAMAHSTGAPIPVQPKGRIPAPVQRPVPAGTLTRSFGSVIHIPLTALERARGLRDHIKEMQGRSVGLTGHAVVPRATNDDDAAAADLEAAQVDYIYNCMLEVWLDAPGGGDPILFWSDLNCTAGTPSSMTETLFPASLDSPRSFFNGNQLPTFSCSGGPSCETPTASTAPNVLGGFWLLVLTDFQVVGTDGVLYDLGTLDNIQVFNGVYAIYPFIDSTRTDLQDAERTVPPGSNYTPFPDNVNNDALFFTACDDNRNITVPPACPRDSNFNSRLRTVYANNGWTIPTSTDPNRSSPDAHHIKPLQWAGGNNPGDPVIPNGVMLDPVVHDQFSYWWSFFSSQTSQPSSDGEDD
jgi:hypothetical protein